MITKKYMVYIEVFESIVCDDMEISKKQYNQFIKQLNENITTESPDAIQTELIEERIIEHAKYVEHELHYTVGCSHFVLTKLECVSGFQFTKK